MNSTQANDRIEFRIKYKKRLSDEKRLLNRIRTKAWITNLTSDKFEYEFGSLTNNRFLPPVKNIGQTHARTQLNVDETKENMNRTTASDRHVVYAFACTECAIRSNAKHDTDESQRARERIKQLFILPRISNAAKKKKKKKMPHTFGIQKEWFFAIMLSAA